MAEIELKPESSAATAVSATSRTDRSAAGVGVVEVRDVEVERDRRAHGRKLLAVAWPRLPRRERRRRHRQHPVPAAGAARALGIPQVSLYVGWGGDLRPEPDYEDLDAFYVRLSESADLPVTSQPSVGDFLAVFEPLAAAGRDIVSIHIAGGLSGTCESGREAARIVAEQHSVRVEIVDGQSGAGGLGCLVVAAARAAEAGADADAVVAAVASARESLDIWFALDTLEYLRRGGRIGAAQALVGSALKIKPILTFGTEIAPVGRVRTRRRAFERMVGYLHELHDRGADGLDRAARAVARGRRAPRRGGHRDLRLRAAVLHPGRPRARRPPRLGDAGRRDGDRLRPFRIEVPEAALRDLRERSSARAGPEAETVADWSQGVPLAYLRELCGYWAAR